MAKINLFFDQFEAEDNPGYTIVRLKCGIQFKTKEGWNLPYSGVIDTGAHVSVLPLSVWQELLCQSLQDYKIYGLSKKKECTLQGTLATVNLILVDEQGNQSAEMSAVFFLAETDEVPLILGFTGLLERLKVTFHFANNLAFIEDFQNG